MLGGFILEENFARHKRKESQEGGGREKKYGRIEILREKIRVILR